MAIARREGKRFDSSSPVASYWLANCVGFTVTGGSSGVVVALDACVAGSQVPEALVVRRRHRRLRRLPVSAVVSVVPGEGTLVAGRVPGRAELLTRRGFAGAARRSVLLAQVVVLLAVVGRHRARRAWLLGAPSVAAASELALAVVITQAGRRLRETARLIRSVPWRRFGPSVRSATTRASQALSSGWSRLRTTSSPRPSASDSAGEARTTSST